MIVGDQVQKQHLRCALNRESKSVSRYCVLYAISLALGIALFWLLPSTDNSLNGLRASIGQSFAAGLTLLVLIALALMFIMKIGVLFCEVISILRINDLIVGIRHHIPEEQKTANIKELVSAVKVLKILFFLAAAATAATLCLLPTQLTHCLMVCLGELVIFGLIVWKQKAVKNINIRK